MLIRRIVVEDFGLYQGRHEFDLTPRVKYRRERPIILFGGKNGAGKTTLLEAVRLALYGRTALGARVRQVDYDSFLRGRVHRSRNGVPQPDRASVAVEFDYVGEGVCKTYRVQRSWRLKGNSHTEEEFRLYENGQTAKDMPDDIAEGFAREIVPEGLSQLFFFDGERIRELAEDDTGDQVLAESIKALLGLDIVERLAADLAIYTSRKTGQLADDDEQSRLASLSAEVERLERDAEAKDEQIASLRTKIDGIEADIRQAEDQLRKDGHSFGRNRDDLKARAALLEAEIDRAEKELRSLCEGLYPLALCPNTNGKLLAQLQQEADDRRNQLVASTIDDLSNSLVARLRRAAESGVCRPKLAKEIAEEMISNVQEHLRRYRLNASVHDEPYLNVAPPDATSISDLLRQASTQVRPTVKQLCDLLERDSRERQEVRRQLDKVPDEDVTGPVVRSIQQNFERLGALKQQLEQLQEARDAIGLSIADATRRCSRMEQAIGKRTDIASQINHVTRVRSALADYLERLTERKIEDLRRSVVECFNNLARKNDVIRDIKIDSHTFAVTLFDGHGAAIPKSELSSGEKQIYAISMLWGLARTSGRPLPVIIDTPLSRLDSDHRMNLCKKYFPQASHQVILLSTDTEIDQPLFEVLSPEVSRSYHLQYDAEAVCTTASEGYFWRETANV